MLGKDTPEEDPTPRPTAISKPTRTNAETRPSVTHRKPAAIRTTAKTATLPAAPRNATSRPAATAKALVIQDAVSLTRDLQAALRDAASSPLSDRVVTSSATSSTSPSGGELDVLSKYLSRALVISDHQSTNMNVTVASKTGTNVTVPADSSTVDDSSPISQVKALSENRQEIVLAKHVINAGLKTLLNVYNSGYRFPTQSGIIASTGKRSTWKDPDVTKVVDACWQAFQTIDRLRPELDTESRRETYNEADGASDAGTAEESNRAVKSEDGQESAGARKAILEMEKIRTVLISRCWMLGMVRQ